MGIVARQSVKNTIYSFMGLGLATFYTIFIMPKVFNDHPEYWGLVQLIMSYVTILSTFSMLGMPSIFIRFSNLFKTKKQPEFLFFGLVIASIGFLVIAILFFVFRGSVMKIGQEKNELFTGYLFNMFIILYSYVLFSIFMNYARMNFRTSFPTFLNDSFIKFITLGLMLLFWFNLISFNQFMWLYTFGYLLQTLSVIAYLYAGRLLKLRISFDVFKNPYIKEIAVYGLINILSSGAITLINRVDIVMVGQMISLEAVAYYATGYFFITVLMVPVRSIISIAVPLFSQFIQNNDDQYRILYRKTMINIFITSGFIYLFIVFNIDSLMYLLGEKFGQVKVVVLILASSKLYEALNYLNMSMIVYSKYYKYDFIFQLSLLILTIITNIIFIPLYGINGAAMATAISIFLNSTARWIFVYVKFNVTTFTREVIYFGIFLAACILLNYLVSFHVNVYLSIVIKSAFLSVFFLVFLLTTKISADINNFLVNLLRILSGKKISKGI